MIQRCENRREWLEARRGGIGASDVAAILGRCRFRSPWAVWQEKVDSLPDEPEEEPRRNHPTDAEMGHRHEPMIAGLFEDYCWDEDLPGDWRIWDPGDFTLYWAEDGLCFCTPDRILIDHYSNPFAVLELKTAKQEQARRFKLQFPEGFQIQTQMQMHCMELNLVYFAALLWGSDFKWFKQERNQRFLDAVLPKLQDFWRLVETKTPPLEDFHPATAQALSTHYSEPEATELQLGDDFDGASTELLGIEAKLKELARKQAAIQNRVKGALGNATAGVAPDGSFYTWRPDKNGVRTFRHKGGKADD